VSVHAALVAYLKTVSAITTLVGSSPARIYPFERLQGAALPAITYFRVDGNVDGMWGGHPLLTRSRMQIDCWSNNHETSLSLLAAVRAATDGFTGSFASTLIKGARIAEMREDFERANVGGGVSDTEWFRQSIDWIVWHH
jgi:hypothetical protein